MERVKEPLLAPHKPRRKRVVQPPEDLVDAREKYATKGGAVLPQYPLQMTEELKE